MLNHISTLLNVRLACRKDLTTTKTQAKKIREFVTKNFSILTTKSKNEIHLNAHLQTLNNKHFTSFSNNYSSFLKKPTEVLLKTSAAFGHFLRYFYPKPQQVF